MSEKKELENLIVLIQNGNQNAFGQFYDICFQSVFQYIFSIVKNKEYAQDLTHDTFIQIYQNIKLYKNTGHPMAWIVTVARNITYMSLRKMQRETTVDYPIDLNDNSIAQINDKMMIQTMFSHLSNEEREIIVMHVLYGFSFRDISHIMHLKLTTVLSKYHRSLKKLKTKYGGKENE
ncbi:MAG: RNA polymerase sigma factor [Faecalibacillus sp.]